MVTVVLAMAFTGAAIAVRQFARCLRAPPPPVEVLPGHEALGPLAEELRDALRADRVAVIVADLDRIDGWRVAACIGAPGLLGSRLPVAERRASRTIGADEAGALGLPGDVCWTYAHVPMTQVAGTAGAIMLAARRELPFSPGELTLIERVARTRAPEFERRRRARVA